MSWKIVEFGRNASNEWKITFENTSGGTLSTDDFTFLFSSSSSGPGSGFENFFALSTLPGGPIMVPAGTTFSVGAASTGADLTIDQSGSFGLVDLLGIGDFGPNTIDSVGDRFAATNLGSSDTVYTASPTRTQDTTTDDAFSFATDFTASSPFCFAAGTRIATPEGFKVVERLDIGDLVLTETGAAVPVLWLGRQTVRKAEAGPHMQPVRFRAGSLGRNVPDRDLTVTADHGMVIDGLVINASALVNHATIDFVPLGELPDEITYYHIETEAHDVILANGARAETFVDVAARRQFDNYQEYLDLYGAERMVREMDRARISSARLVPWHVRERLDQRIGAPLNGQVA